MTRIDPKSIQRQPGLRFRPSPLAHGIAMVIASGLAAQASAENRVLEEVVVTATKRSESVQDVPLAITALTGDFVRDVNLNDVKDLVSFTPGVSGNSQDSFIDAISVRGVRTQDFGVGGDPSAAFFKNDLYEGRNGSAVTSLFDMERAEILRGPQGFLFSRNSIGGAFSVYTAKAKIADEMDGYLDLDAGQNNRLRAEGAVNIPVNDSFALRIAGYHSEQDGFVDNLFDGSQLIAHDKSALRLSGTFIGDNLTARGTAEYEDREQSGSVYRAIETGVIWETFEAALGDVNLGGGEQDANVDRSSGDRDDAKILTLGLQLDYDLGFATVTSNTGYKDHEYYYTEDYDGTPLNINNYGQDQKGDYFQQEIRLASNNDGALSWYAGASYYRENIDTLFKFSGAEDYFCQYYGAYYNSGTTFTGCADLYAYYGSGFSPSADGNLTETGRIIATTRAGARMSTSITTSRNSGALVLAFVTATTKKTSPSMYRHRKVIWAPTGPIPLPQTAPSLTANPGTTLRLGGSCGFSRTMTLCCMPVIQKASSLAALVVLPWKMPPALPLAAAQPI